MSHLPLRATQPFCKDSVFGYIREHEKKESIDVPKVIMYLCLSFYPSETLYSSPQSCLGVDITGKIITYKGFNKSTSSTSLYGSIAVLAYPSISEYRWTFQTLGVLRFRSFIAFGLLSEAKRNQEDYPREIVFGQHSQDARADYYGVTFNRLGALSSQGLNHSACILKKYTQIEMVLNVKDKTLHYRITIGNGSDWNITLRNVDVNRRPYVLSVTVSTRGSDGGSKNRSKRLSGQPVAKLLNFVIRYDCSENV